MWKISLKTALFIIGTSFGCITGYSQKPIPVSAGQDHFPYAFSNFVWWNDADLRADLKKRLPSLGEEIGRGSTIESKVRLMLTQLLKEKGIEGEVQVMEPSADVFSQKRAPEAPPPAIIFSVLSPSEILVEGLVLENAPGDAAQPLSDVAARMKGREYSAVAFWSDKQKIKDGLQQAGYLSAEVMLDHGTPHKERDRYLVPVTAKITAGPKFHVSSIHADGGPLVQGRDLSPYFAVKAGDVAMPYAFGRLAGALRSVYWHAGYPDVDFTGPAVLDEPNALASYQLKVTPGPLYHVRSIAFENLDPAQEAKAREILGLKTGDIYDLLAVSGMNRKLSDFSSPLKGYSCSDRAKEDKQDQVVDLTIIFYKQQ